MEPPKKFVNLKSRKLCLFSSPIKNKIFLDKGQGIFQGGKNNLLGARF